jgi:hypothetical protein
MRVGLKKLLQPGEEVPALFTDPLFVRSSYWVVSTSAVFSKHFPVYGWGEVGLACDYPLLELNSCLGCSRRVWRRVYDGL